MDYIKKFKNAKVLIDPTLPRHEDYPYDDIDNWHDLYPDAHFEVPPDALMPKGKPVRVTIWVDADHARDKVSCRSVSGIIMMVNHRVVQTFTKCQTTVESSTYDV